MRDQRNEVLVWYRRSEVGSEVRMGWAWFEAKLGNSQSTSMIYNSSFMWMALKKQNHFAHIWSLVTCLRGFKGVLVQQSNEKGKTSLFPSRSIIIWSRLYLWFSDHVPAQFLPPDFHSWPLRCTTTCGIIYTTVYVNGVLSSLVTVNSGTTIMRCSYLHLQHSTQNAISQPHFFF